MKLFAVFVGGVVVILVWTCCGEGSKSTEKVDPDSSSSMSGIGNQ